MIHFNKISSILLIIKNESLVKLKYFCTSIIWEMFLCLVIENVYF